MEYTANYASDPFTREEYYILVYIPAFTNIDQ